MSKKPGWWKRLKLGKHHRKISTQLKFHTKASYHASCLIELSKVVLPNHPGYNGVRDLLRDIKQPTETLERKKCNLECVLNIKPQSE